MKSKSKSKKIPKRTFKVEPKEVTVYDKVLENKDVAKLYLVEDQTQWEEEVEALKNIKSGKTEMEKQSADEFLKELKEEETNECPCCKANCKCCVHPSGTVGHRCSCRCHPN